MVIQIVAAVASETVSAQYTPITPIFFESIKMRGINNIALRSKAMKIETLACPRAINVL